MSPGLADAQSAPDHLAEPGHLYDVRGVKLYARISGSGPAILFLHGGLSSFDQAFAGQVEYFARFRTVIGVDQRGHGRSPDNEEPFSYAAMAEDTAALMRQLRLAPVDVVGHSDGGNVGLLLASRHPELVRRLVVSGANSSGASNGLMAYARFRWMPAARFAAGLSESLRLNYARVSPDGAEHWPVMVAKTQNLWSTWTVIGARELAAIKVPVLVMSGDHDVIRLEHTIQLFRSLPRGEICILPATGHETMKQRSDEFNRLITRFLDAP